MKNKRRIDIDFIRGIAVFCVLWGHSIQYFSQGKFNFFQNSVFKFIYGFHMPLFMLICGYLFYKTCQKDNFKNNLKKLIKSTIYPSFIFGSIFFIISILFDNDLHQTIQGKQLIKLFYECITSLWFLWSVFFCSLFVLLIVNIVKNSYLKYIFFVLGFIIMSIIPEKIEIAKTMNLWMYPYFIGGYLFNEHKDRFKYNVINYIGFFSIPLYFLLIKYFDSDFYIYTTGIAIISGGIRQIKIDIYRWIVGLLGSFSIIYISKKILEKDIHRNSIINFFIKLGEKSLQIYILQAFLLERIATFLYNGLLTKIDLSWIVADMLIYNFIITPLIAISFALIILLLNNVLNKSKLSKFLFGR